MTEKVQSWLNNARFGWLSIAFIALGVFYSVVIQNNNLQNEVQKGKENQIKLETQIIVLQDKKLDKETFTLILNSLNDLRTDVRSFQFYLNEYMNKSR